MGIASLFLAYVFNLKLCGLEFQFVSIVLLSHYSFLILINSSYYKSLHSIIHAEETSLDFVFPTPEGLLHLSFLWLYAYIVPLAFLFTLLMLNLGSSVQPLLCSNTL